ncbi:hypothetical protein IFT59_07285 [Rhizobium sp. CFBP 8752]|uniref:hypothetical protein n=1 Tax=Rhizobium sp. CFBP 8752 TaxID=2775301 RepID=UPI00178400ED|nr:hypothetical protein [Rhizobium sp. CFBP 8752]MBD8663055.1 hypothetical protein [Rhizobium sp. CFBP 8752]
MTGPELNNLYGAMISADARVDVPDAWMPAVHEAMQALVDLPTEVRAYIIVVGIDTDAEGCLRFSTVGSTQVLTPRNLAMIREITDRAVVATRKRSFH